MQQHIIVGHLGTQPEVREFDSGKAVTNFNIAVNERNSNGTESTTWYRVAAWNGLGGACAQHLEKGSKVLVRGSRLKASAYIGKDGEARATLELTADEVEFL